MQDIKNIIFDFGNVLFDLDLPALERNLRPLLGRHADEAWAQLRRERVLELYETGGISTDEFLETIRSAATPAPSPDEIVAAWNSIFIGMPRSRFDFLLHLRRDYKVFLLSNINDMHERWIADYMIREHGIHEYESRYFDGVYFSHLIRLRKPDPVIYEYVLADAEILPEETLFFDDVSANVESAIATGIRSVLHPAGSEIITHAKLVLSG